MLGRSLNWVTPHRGLDFWLLFENISKSGRKCDLTGQTAPPELSQIPKHCTAFRLRVAPWLPQLRENSLWLHMMRGLQGLEETRGPELKWRRRKKTWHSFSSTEFICLSAQPALFGRTQKTLEANSDTNLLFAQLIIWGSPGLERTMTSQQLQLD